MQHPAFRRLGEGQKQGQGAAPSISLPPGLPERHKERRSSSCSLTPPTTAMHIRTASLCHLSYNSSREGRKQKHKHSSEQELEALQLSGTWARGSGAGAMPAGLRLARTCLLTNQVTGPHTSPRSAHSLLPR